MKSSAILINLARGPVIDEPALIEALRQARSAAGLDVYTREPLEASPLFELPNVVTLPHIGSATHETRYAMAERAVNNLIAALTGERPDRPGQSGGPGSPLALIAHRRPRWRAVRALKGYTAAPLSGRPPWPGGPLSVCQATPPIGLLAARSVRPRMRARLATARGRDARNRPRGART